jgi:hypothetical protein
MELSFVCDNSADASYLAQELELALRKNGVPAKALSLKRASSENMDIGSILSIDLATATEILSPVGSIASLVTCIYEVASKYHSGVIVQKDEGRIKIPASQLSFKRVQNAVAKAPKPKPKSRPRT